MEWTELHMYSKKQYKSEQEPDDQLSGGSIVLCCSPGASRETGKKLSKREAFNAVTKKVKRENQNKSWFELCAESWSRKTEQIKVTGNKILLINSKRGERHQNSETWDKRQLGVETAHKCTGKEGLGVTESVWEMRNLSELFCLKLTSLKQSRKKPIQGSQRYNETKKVPQNSPHLQNIFEEEATTFPLRLLMEVATLKRWKLRGEKAESHIIFWNPHHLLHLSLILRPVLVQIRH